MASPCLVFRRVLPAAVRGRVRRAMFEWLQLTWTTSSGIGLRVANYNEWIIYNEVFVDGEYDAAIDAALTARGDAACCASSISAPTSASSPCGSSIASAPPGSATRHARRHWSKPIPISIPVLRARLLDEQRPRTAVRIVPGLAGEPSGTATLFRSPDALGDSSVLRPTADAVSVPYVDLTPLMSDAPVIDLLKCDIEGSELTVLEHYPDLLQRTRIAVIEHPPRPLPRRSLPRTASAPPASCTKPSSATAAATRCGCTCGLAVPRFLGS